VNSPYVFSRNGTIELRDEHRIWVVTPQKAYAETTMYELVVTATESTVYPYKVVVDIIDYNPLTDIERVSRPVLLLPLVVVCIIVASECNNF